MNILYLKIGIYIFFFTIIILFFILGKVNIYKFLKLDKSIKIISNFIFLLLIIFGLFGLIIIIFTDNIKNDSQNEIEKTFYF